MFESKTGKFILPEQNWHCCMAVWHPCDTWLWVHPIFFYCHTKKERTEREMIPLCYTLLNYMNCRLIVTFYIYILWAKENKANLVLFFPFLHGRPYYLFNIVWANFNLRVLTEVWRESSVTCFCQTFDNGSFRDDEMWTIECVYKITKWTLQLWCDSVPSAFIQTWTVTHSVYPPADSGDGTEVSFTGQCPST